MITNDVLRSIRYTLDLSDAKVAEMIRVGEHNITSSDVANFLRKEGEEGFVECGTEVLSAFLDGLIINRRGRMEARPGQDKKPENRLNNNVILKKLRIAFELKEDDLHQVLGLAGISVSKPELSALFRQKGHKNYRVCGDQFLRNFLKGLALRLRGPQA